MYVLLNKETKLMINIGH